MDVLEDIKDSSKKELLITIGCGNKFAYKNNDYNSINISYDEYEFFWQINESIDSLKEIIDLKLNKGFSFEEIMFLGSCKEGYAGVLLGLRLKEIFPEIKIGVTSFALPSYFYYRRLNFYFDQWNLNYPVYARPLKCYHEPFYTKSKGLFDLKKQFEIFKKKGVSIFLWVMHGKSYSLDRLSIDIRQLKRIDEFISESVESGDDHNPLFVLYKDKKKYNSIVSENFRKIKSYEAIH